MIQPDKILNALRALITDLWEVNNTIPFTIFTTPTQGNKPQVLHFVTPPTVDEKTTIATDILPRLTDTSEYILILGEAWRSTPLPGTLDVPGARPSLDPNRQEVIIAAIFNRQETIHYQLHIDRTDPTNPKLINEEILRNQPNTPHALINNPFLPNPSLN